MSKTLEELPEESQKAFVSAPQYYRGTVKNIIVGAESNGTLSFWADYINIHIKPYLPLGVDPDNELDPSIILPNISGLAGSEDLTVEEFTILWKDVIVPLLVIMETNTHLIRKAVGVNAG